MSLQKSAVSAVKWTSLSSALTTILRILQMSILARLLTPEDFGLMAMIAVIINFSAIFADMGINNAIIHKQNITRQSLSSLYWLNVFNGFIVFAVIVLCAPLVVNFYAEPRLKDIIHLAAVSAIITPFGQQFQVLLQKKLLFNRLAKIELASVSITALTAIILGYLGFGVFSLVWASLAGALLRVIILVTTNWSEWKPQLHFRVSDLKGYIGFGLYQMAERSLDNLAANMDYLFIGHFLGAEILGFYRIAYELIIQPISRVNPILTQVAFPVFSKIQDDNIKIRRWYLKMLKLLALINFPVLIGLAAVATVAIPVIFGAGWEQSVILVQILSFVGVLKALGHPIGGVILAKGRADVGFKLNVFVTSLSSVAFYLAAPFGSVTLSWTYLIMTIFYFIVGGLLLEKMLNLGIFISTIVTVYKLFLIGVVMGLVVHYVCGSSIFLYYESQQTTQLALLIGLGATLYCAMLYVFEKNYLFSFKELLQRK